MRPDKYLTIRWIGWVPMLALLILGFHAQRASATFIVDIDPGGTQFFNSSAYTNVSSFTGEVGQNSGLYVDVGAVSNVDSGAGFAIIYPAGTALLTRVTFTPQDPNAFGDFSFRGQLLEAGTIHLKVWDNQGTLTPFEFDFAVAHANQDFQPFGIISLDGETIKEVEISDASGFKSVKQVNFSNATAPVPEPGTMVLLGSGLVGLAGWGRKKFRK